MPRLDPRAYQIAVLVSLLVAGLAWLDFDLSAAQIGVTVGTALVVQVVAARIAGLPGSNWSSALISSLSLCLLLRTTDLRLAACAAAVAIGSKFAIRVRSKHVFNPTNLALVVMLAVSDHAWVSPGQWGDAAFAAFLLACVGIVVATRAERADVSVAFLAFYVGLMLARALWLGDPLSIPMHRLQNGALLLFTFFMISDPKTTPDSRAGRMIYAAAIALGAYYVHFVLFRTNGLLWSLAACSLLVPVLDRVLPGPRYAWPTPPSPRRPDPGGLPAAVPLENPHETLAHGAVRSRPRALVH
jgi:Na+-transporting NADH:ubiquinone oxidoreductase subunit NqrB